MTISIKANNDGTASIQNLATGGLILNSDGSVTQTIKSNNGDQLAGFRNKIINGNFDIWQRSVSYSGTVTSFSISGTNAVLYGADRWQSQSYVGSSGSGSTTVVQSMQTFTLGQGIVPGEPTYFMRTQLTALGTLSGTSSCVRTQQWIEGVRTFAGQTVTISFWAKADAARQMAVVLCQSFGTGGSPSATTGTGQTINVTTSWQYFTITLNVPSIAGKTIGTSSDALGLQFFLYKSDNNATNDNLGPVGTYTSGMYLDLARVQVESGTIATPFEYRFLQTELALCQRYYIKFIQLLNAGYNTAGGGIYMDTPFPSTMRSTPSVLYSNIGYANTGSLSLNVGYTTHMRTQVIISATGSGYAAFDAEVVAEY